MELLEVIQSRRSIHEYKEVLVEEKILEYFFSEASWAPNHRMKEPWNIRLYQEEGKKSYVKAVLESYRRQGFFDGYEQDKQTRLKDGIKDFLFRIPHHALIYMEKDEDERKYEEDYAAVCAYIQNLQLLAWQEQVGVLWTTSPYLHDHQFAEDIGLNPSIYKLVSVLQIGYPKRIPDSKRRTPIHEKLHVFDGK
jgi:nitroreductase